MRIKMINKNENENEQFPCQGFIKSFLVPVNTG